MPEGAWVGSWLGLRVGLGRPGGGWGAWGAGAWEEVGGVWEDLGGTEALECANDALGLRFPVFGRQRCSELIKTHVSEFGML